MAINMIKKGKVFSIIFLLVLIDQLTKFIFRDVDLIGNIIYLKSYRNTGSVVCTPKCGHLVKLLITIF